MLNPYSGILELLGMIVGVGAWFCSLAATIMPNWMSLSPELLVLESYEQGLWETCVFQDGATSDCLPFDTVLGLSYNLTVARICMCMSDALALLGLLIALPGLKLVGICERWRVKRGMKITAGVMGLTAGVLELVAVSTIAHETVLQFYDHTLPESMPRWEFGDAMFIGWAASFFHVVSAVLFFVSCCGSKENEEEKSGSAYFVYNPEEKFQPVDGSSRKRVEYV
ncbi:putative claudin-24 [Neoarius graeffei]|uniref:putative claudin-24 n=1 Tax=Neoarius graeffei TaxID=443677 RepID=UPI00298BE29A|nr:putative claudin-24 [Neoarius graeffei]